MNTTNLISTPNITGNIGSCEVKTTYLSIDSFNTESIAVNSCTGEVISHQTYYDWSYVYFPLIIVFVIVAVFGTLRVMFD